MSKKKKCRSWSGVLPISVALDGRHFSCAYDCAYCPNESVENGAPKTMARSYLSSEGTFLRGETSDFDPLRQILRRLLELQRMGHTVDKLEIIVLGGTWDSYSKTYRNDFIHSIYYACNLYAEGWNVRPDVQEWMTTHQPFLHHRSIDNDLLVDIRARQSLQEEQYRNEHYERTRIVGLQLETRPDQISLTSMQEYRRLGCTYIQLGIQHTDNTILDKIQRRHTIETSERAIRLLKDNGFKVAGHIMPDLPFSSPDKDRDMMRQIFESHRFQLDYVKIYPCLDLPFTKIREWKQQGVWRPYAESHFEEFLKVLAEGMSRVKPWTRVNRLHRDFPKAKPGVMELGYDSNVIPTNLHQLVDQYMEKTMQTHSIDIRSREIKSHITSITNQVMPHFRIVMREIPTATRHRHEYFISLELSQSTTTRTRDALIGFLRLRILEKPSSSMFTMTKSLFLNSYKSIALIREVHIYGFMPGSSWEDESPSVQHQGFGTLLLEVAKHVAFSMHSCAYMGVISGVGVRSYYRKRGFVAFENDDSQFLWLHRQWSPGLWYHPVSRRLFLRMYHHRVVALPNISLWLIILSFLSIVVRILFLFFIV